MFFWGEELFFFFGSFLCICYDIRGVKVLEDLVISWEVGVLV